MTPSQESSLETLFYTESQKRLKSIRETLAAYKKGLGGLDKILATLHTLKGSSNMMGMKELAQDFHLLEEEFGKVDSPQSEMLAEAESLLRTIEERLEGEPSAETSFAPNGATHDNALVVFQHLLGSVSRLQTLSANLKGREYEDIDLEVGRITELAFRSVFAPARNLFAGLHELQKAVGKSERKTAKLVCRTSTDQILRDYLTELRGTLVHLVTNCMVHGIEAPAVRREAGKSPEGVITVEVYQEEQRLCLEIRDDGGGVDVGKLRTAFERENGEQKWDTLGHQARMNLLFEQGRTLREATDIHSGRGVGLAAVRESVERLNGKVYFTPVEVGTALRIELPSPFFLSRCLMVRDQGRLFGILTSSVRQVKATEKERSRPSLAQCFGYQIDPDSSGSYTLCPPSNEEDPSAQAGFTVTECSGLQELLVYALPRVDNLNLSAVGLAECFGEQVFVVDLEELAPTRAVHHIDKKSVEPGLRKRLLVVDDSITTRSILSDVLRRAGYAVEEARDGNEGRIALETGQFDLVVSDLEMPHCNGLQLLEWIRSEESPVSDIPFLLFTSRDDVKSFETAQLLGADRCLSKGHFQEAPFLKLLEQLL